MLPPLTEDRRKELVKQVSSRLEESRVAIRNVRRDIIKDLKDAEKEKLSYEIAQKSIVLLKNDGVLPLKKGTKLAVIGPHADSLRYPVSGYTYPAYIEMMQAGSSGQETTFGGIADEQ